MDTMEAALRAAVSPDAAFRDLSEKATPDYLTMLTNLIFWALVGLLCLLVMTLMLVPAAGGLGMLPMVLTLAGGVVVTVPMSFLVAGALHGLALASGGKGDFARSYQLVSLLGSMAPVAAAVIFIPVPMAWILPTVYLTYLAARGIALLHGAPDGQSWLVIGICGGLLTAGQVAFRQNVERFSRDLETRAALYGTDAKDADRSSGVSAAALSAPSDPFGQAETSDARTGTSGSGNGAQADGPVEAGALRPSPGMEMPGIIAPEGASPDGSLNMIGRTGDSSFAGEQGDSAPGEDGAPPDQVQSVATNLLSIINKQINENPETLNKMPPEQRERFKALLNTANQLKAKSEQKRGPGTGRSQPMSPEQTQEMMQQLLREFTPPKSSPKNGSRPRKGRSRPAPDEE